MKNTGKNSQNNNDALIYLFLGLLIVILVSVLAYFLLNPSEAKTTPKINFEEELGEYYENPDDQQMAKLVEEVDKRWKSIRRILNDENKPLSASEREKAQQTLNNNQLANILNNLELKNLNEKEKSSVFAKLYEQGKELVKLKNELITDNRTYEELKRQLEVMQPAWQISDDEQEEISANLDKWLKVWYHKFMDEELTEGEKKSKVWEYMEPKWFEGQRVYASSPAAIGYWKTRHDICSKETGEKYTIDLTQPVKINFNGYGGFIKPEDLKNSTEGKTTVGLTLSDKISSIKNGKKGDPRYSKCKVIGRNSRNINIKLKREIFFSRGGYDKWLIKVYRTDKGGWRHVYNDISLEEIIETISHELAHAIVVSLKADYEGERGGGHGKLFDNFHERMEKMMEKTPEFTEFKNWWRKKK